jgi:serine/threonine protein kinase
MNSESKVINQGGFGCIFYPSLTCKKERTNSEQTKEYVSKLVEKNFSSKNEIEVGEIVKKIPFYSLYYVPILENCPANLSKVGSKEIKKCNIIDKKEEHVKYILLKMKYLKNIKFTEYLLTNKSKKHVLNIIFDTYSYFLFSLEQLMSFEIVHFDFKWDNAVIDLKTELPVILDFGISIPIRKLLEYGGALNGDEDKEYKEDKEDKREEGNLDKTGNENKEKNEDKYDVFRNYFYTYFPRYSLWPPEVHAMCYVLHEHSRITTDSLKQLVDEYVDSNAAFTIFSPEFLEKYKKLCFEMMEYLIDKPRKYVIHECLKFWSTWDNYALSISYFQIIQFISSSGFTSNAFLLSFSKILLGNVHPDPSRRSNYTTTRYEYKSIFYQETSIRDFELLVDNFDFERFRSESVKESRRNESLFSHLSIKSSRKE